MKKKAYKLASLWLSRNNQCYCWELLAACFYFYCFALGQKAVFIWHSRCSLYISLYVLFCCFSPNQTNTQCIHSSPLIAFVGARFDSRPDRESFFSSPSALSTIRDRARARRHIHEFGHDDRHQIRFSYEWGALLVGWMDERYSIAFLFITFHANEVNTRRISERSCDIAVSLNLIQQLPHQSLPDLNIARWTMKRSQRALYSGLFGSFSSLVQRITGR